jgi:hypothetical protein
MMHLWASPLDFTHCRDPAHPSGVHTVTSTTKQAVLPLAQVMEMDLTHDMSKETRTLKSFYMPLTFPLVQKPLSMKMPPLVAIPKLPMMMLPPMPPTHLMYNQRFWYHSLMRLPRAGNESFASITRCQKEQDKEYL